MIAGENCPHRATGSINYTCHHKDSKKNECWVEDCPLKIIGIKKQYFKKKVSFLTKCPVCGEEIQLKKMPELNTIIWCLTCRKDIEVLSKKNYEYWKESGEKSS